MFAVKRTCAWLLFKAIKYIVHSAHINRAYQALSFHFPMEKYPVTYTTLSNTDANYENVLSIVPIVFPNKNKTTFAR